MEAHENNNNNSGITTSYSNPYPSQNHLLTSSKSGPGDGGGGGGMYPHTVAGKAPATAARRKRGRPRKYGTPEAAAAAKRAAVPAKRTDDHHHRQYFGGGGGGGGGASSHSSSASGSSKTSNFASFGGQGFTPHVVNIAVGEDVAQKILLFMQQTKRELCILSASGTISSAALRQPDTSGGNIAYQGRFDIVSLTGSYVRSEHGGKAGGLSACLCTENGQIVGGSVCGPLIAAGPVEVIVATFLIDPKKDINVGFKGDVSGSTMPSPVSASPPVYRPVIDSSGGFRVTGMDDHHNMDGNAYMMQSQWRSGLNYDFTGNTGHNTRDSPENGDYDQMPD